MPTIIRTIETSNDGSELFLDSGSTSVVNNTDTVERSIVGVNDGLDSFSAKGVETIEVIEGELISTVTEDTPEGTITTKAYADDVIIRKVDGVEVSRTNIKN